jgi:hypothetical protein
MLAIVKSHTLGGPFPRDLGFFWRLSSSTRCISSCIRQAWVAAVLPCRRCRNNGCAACSTTGPRHAPLFLSSVSCIHVLLETTTSEFAPRSPPMLATLWACCSSWVQTMAYVAWFTPASRQKHAHGGWLSCLLAGYRPSDGVSFKNKEGSKKKRAMKFQF